MARKLLIKFETCVQVSPEDYKLRWEEKIFSETDTLADVVAWASKKQIGTERLLSELRLSEPEI